MMGKATFMATVLCGSIIVSGCGMSNTAKGGIIGAGGGAALGAIIGKIAGNTAIGAAVGTAVGTTAGALIGRKMDKVKKETAAAVPDAKVETVQDKNGLQAVKVTFDSGILFNTGKSDLSSSAQSSLSKFANNVLLKNATADVSIQGYTDNQGWANSTATESQQKNQALSQQRAQSVSNYLRSCGVTTSQIKSVEGFGESNPVADNSTKEGQQQNRRVEVYLYASQQMINEANNGTLQ